MKTVGWLTVSSFLLLACADPKESEPEPTRTTRCEALREHLVAIRLEGLQVDREQHAHAHREALGTAFIEACATNHDEAALTCALAAADSESVSACLTKDVP